MKTLFALIALLTLPQLTSAQTSRPTANAMYVSADLLYINQTDSPALRYSAQYTRSLGTGRWQLETGLTFASRSVREQLVPFAYTYVSTRSRLATADVALLYTLLASPRHTLRIGGGPALWYLNDIRTNTVSIELTQQGTLNHVYLTDSRYGGVTLGVSLRAEYDYALTSSFSIGAQTSIGGNVLTVKDPNKSNNVLLGSQTTVGIRAGYHF